MSDGRRGAGATAIALLACTTGRAFLALAARLGDPARAALPGVALCLAADAVAATTPWVASAVLGAPAGGGDGAALEATAHRVLADGVPAWWSAPLDPRVQRWAGTSRPGHAQPGHEQLSERPRRATARGGGWEAYAQRPREWVVTSDEVVDAAGRRRGGVDEWEAHGLWDGPAAHAPLVERWSLPDDVVVHEVDDPGDWAALVAAHPGPTTEYGGRSVDLVAAAGVLDGVHVTLRGLLTARQVATGGGAPADARPWSLESPGTRWLRPVAHSPLEPDRPLPAAAHDVVGVAPSDVTGDPRFEEGDEVDGSELDGERPRD